MSETDVLAFKAIAVVFLVSWLCSLGYMLHKNKRRAEYSLFELILGPILFTLVATVIILLFGSAVLVWFL